MKYQFLLYLLFLIVACASNPAPLTAPAGAETGAVTPHCPVETFTIYFDQGASELSDEADAVIDAVCRTYARCKLYKIEILGHADASGDAIANQAISAERAEAVMAALKARGVDAERAHRVACGEQDAVTASGANEPLNRKTEVRLVPES